MNPAVLLLGGSEQQIIAIETAYKLGYRTVLCDYLEDNPGQAYADSFYLVSTTDKEAVLSVARKECVDGIVAYASDPAAPTASFVSEELDLPGLRYSMALNFCEKHRFRTFLSDNGFNVPRSLEFNVDEGVAADAVEAFRFPVVVKPTDSSGSKGVTIVRSRNELEGAVEAAKVYSRNRVLIIEEFIERAHQHVVEAELTVSGGEVVTWGLINSIRDTESNPLLPAAYSYPLELDYAQKSIVKEEIAALIHASGMQAGSFNIEMIIDADGRLFFLDAGPRNGGNMLPDFISMIARGDIVEATLRMAMGERPGSEIALDGEEGGFWGLVVFHSSQDGVFSHVDYSSTARNSLVKECMFVEPGDEVKRFVTCDKAFGFAFLHFEKEQEKLDVMNDLGRHVRIVLQ